MEHHVFEVNTVSHNHQYIKYTYHYFQLLTLRYVVAGGSRKEVTYRRPMNMTVTIMTTRRAAPKVMPKICAMESPVWKREEKRKLELIKQSCQICLNRIDLNKRKHNKCSIFFCVCGYSSIPRQVCLQKDGLLLGSHFFFFLYGYNILLFIK